jgi:predicted MPP superfamily phosphohydrolase
MEGWVHLLFGIALAVMIFSPVIVNMLTGSGYRTLTTVLSYVCYLWMGILFLFISINVVIDIYRLIVFISSRIWSADIIGYMPAARPVFLATLLLTAGIVAYGVSEARNIAVERLEIKTGKLPAHVSRFRLVQISDIHFSAVNNSMLAGKLVGMIAGLSPDLLVSTGDLIDRGLQKKEKVASLFRSLDVPHGKYAVPGNHEFISGIDEAVLFTENAGFKMLRNEVVAIADFAGIAGIDDRDAARFNEASAVTEDKILEQLNPGRLNIFLKHQPRVEDGSKGRFDIQLSGHTHNGQIFPFTLIVSLFYPHMKGLFPVDGSGFLYVSRGAGTWGPPIRFLTFPEITVIDFVKE